MRVTPISNINTKHVTFGEGYMNNMTPKIGLLSLQNSDKLKFEKNLRLTQEADAVQSNPLKALGCKFAKAYNILFSPRRDSNRAETSYIHLPYMA